MRCSPKPCASAKSAAGKVGSGEPRVLEVRAGSDEIAVDEGPVRRQMRGAPRDSARPDGDKPSAGEVGAGEVGVPQAGRREDGAGQVGVFQIGAFQFGVYQVGADEVGVGEVGTDENRVRKVCAREVGGTEVATFEFRSRCRCTLRGASAGAPEMERTITSIKPSPSTRRTADHMPSVQLHHVPPSLDAAGGMKSQRTLQT